MSAAGYGVLSPLSVRFVGHMKIRDATRLVRASYRGDLQLRLSGGSDTGHQRHSAPEGWGFVRKFRSLGRVPLEWFVADGLERNNKKECVHAGDLQVSKVAGTGNPADQIPRRGGLGSVPVAHELLPSRGPGSTCAAALNVYFGVDHDGFLFYFC